MTKYNTKQRNGQRKVHRGRKKRKCKTITNKLRNNDEQFDVYMGQKYVNKPIETNLHALSAQCKKLQLLLQKACEDISLQQKTNAATSAVESRMMKRRRMWKVKKTFHEDNSQEELSCLNNKIEKVRQLNKESYKDLVREIKKLTKSKLQALKKKLSRNHNSRKNKHKNKDNAYSTEMIENESCGGGRISTTEDAIESILTNYRNATPPPAAAAAPQQSEMKENVDESMLSSEWCVLSDVEENCFKSNERSDEDSLDSGSVSSGGKLPASFLQELESKLKKNQKSKSRKVGKKKNKKKRKKRNKFNRNKGFAFGHKFNEEQFSGIQMKLDRMIIERVDDFVPIVTDEDLISSYDFCEINQEPEIPTCMLMTKNFDKSMDIIKNLKFKLKKTKGRKGKKEKEFHSASEIALQQILARRQHLMVDEDEESIGEWSM